VGNDLLEVALMTLCLWLHRLLRENDWGTIRYPWPRGEHLGSLNS
jgi:hypothetical protein